MSGTEGDACEAAMGEVCLDMEKRGALSVRLLPAAGFDRLLPATMANCRC
jgi:hypothetical protein